MKRKIHFFAMFPLNTNYNDETFYRNIAYPRTYNLTDIFPPGRIYLYIIYKSI